MIYKNKKEDLKLFKINFFKRFAISFLLIFIIGIFLFFVYELKNDRNINEQNFYYYGIITFVFILFFLFAMEISSLIINLDVLKKRASILFFLFYLLGFTLNFLFFNNKFIFKSNPLNLTLDLTFPSFNWIFLLSFFLVSFIFSFMLSGIYFFKNFLIVTIIVFLVFISHIFLSISLNYNKPGTTSTFSDNVIDPFWTLLYLFLTNFIFDISAYLFSCFYQKKGDLAPKISKNKTKKAFLFGTGVSFLVGAIFTLTYSLINEKTFVSFLYNQDEPVFAANLTIIIFISLFIPIFAQLGDLFFSKIKRENQIKDYSRSLSEHGGFLDRFDSFIFSLSFFSLIFLIFNYNWFFNIT